MLNQIPKIKFDKSNHPILFQEDNERANNHYAIISDSVYSFKFAWNSDIAPVIIKVNPNVYSIGIDQHFALVDFNYNTILLSLNLFYNFYDTKINDNYIYVITELEIIKINKTTFEIIEEYGLPDFFEKIEFNNGKVEVSCFGDMVITL